MAVASPPPAPAPSAPSPAPAPSPSTTPTPAATPPPAQPSSPNPFADIDAQFRKAAGEFATGAKPPEKPAEKPKEQPKAPEPAKAATPEPPKPQGGPKELRNQLSLLESQLKAKEESHAKLEAKIKEIEGQGREVPALTERLSRMEKDLAEREATIRALKQESSPEFKKQYEEPIERMAARAESVVKQMTVTDSAGNTRPAVFSDFAKLYAASEVNADEVAEQIFGERGGRVAMKYYNELHRLQQAKDDALQVERANAKANEEKEVAEQATRKEQIGKAWREINTELSESEDYSLPPDDKELNDMQKQALSVYDSQPKTVQEKMVKDAHTRWRTAMYGVERMKRMRLEKENADLKKELEGYKETPPGDKLRKPGGGTQPKAEESWEDGARRAVMNA